MRINCFTEEFLFLFFYLYQLQLVYYYTIIPCVFIVGHYSFERYAQKEICTVMLHKVIQLNEFILILFFIARVFVLGKAKKERRLKEVR